MTASSSSGSGGGGGRGGEDTIEEEYRGIISLVLLGYGVESSITPGYISIYLFFACTV